MRKGGYYWVKWRFDGDLSIMWFDSDLNKWDDGAEEYTDENFSWISPDRLEPPEV